MPRIKSRFLPAPAVALLLVAVLAPTQALSADRSSLYGAPPESGSSESAAAGAPAAFAIVAVDSMSGEWGVAAVSRWIAVGARSLEARAGAGALAALELPDPHHFALTLDRLAQGISARAALDSLLSVDARRGERQLALVDRAGNVAAHTGDRCPAWAGEWIGKGCVCQGVGLRDGLALAAMGRTFAATAGSLGERLLAALETAESIFPLRGPAESAAILVVRAGGGPGGWSDRLVDLRVDEAIDAVQSLKSVYAVHAATFLPVAYARFGDDASRRGDSISAEREYARAEGAFRAAVARSPKDPDALNELAWFLATHGRDSEEAVRFAKAAITKRPRDPNLYDTLAEAEYRSGSLSRAIESMDRAVKYSGGAPRYADRLARWTRERATLEGKGDRAPQGTTPPVTKPQAR